MGGGGGGSNRCMSGAAARASAYCDDFTEDRCPPPKPRDRCAQRDHCHDPPPPIKTDCRKEKKHKKKFARLIVTLDIVSQCQPRDAGSGVSKITYFCRVRR